MPACTARTLYGEPFHHRTILASCATLLFLLLPPTPPAVADVITPSDRVVTRLNVREEPSGQSAIVGKLQRNERAALLESVSHWYKIRLFNGVEGYVSKAWSEQILEAAAAEARIRLGEWNLKKLGHGSSKDLPAVASAIDDNFDIVGIVEVMQKGGGHPGYDTLMTTLGSTWKGLVTDQPRPNTTSGSAEFYAVLYRDGTVRPCEGWDALRYFPDNDGSGSGSGPDLFDREPAFGCFEAGLQGNTVGLDFLLAVYHARWANGNTQEISGEVGHVDEVFAEMATERPGEKDLLIVGDFNLLPSALAGLTTASDRTQGTGSTLNSQGSRTANLYDHVLVKRNADTSEMLGDARVLDVRQVTATEKLFYQTVSDHLPIVVEVRASGADDDGA